MNSEHLARTYYRKVNAKDIDGLLALFTDDAVFTLPDGRRVEGTPAIRAMYERVFEAGGPQPQPVTFIAAIHGVAVEVEVHLADGSMRQMASFFQLSSDDKFVSVGVYTRTEGRG